MAPSSTTSRHISSHRLALGLAAGIVVAWALALGLTLASAADRGALLAVFPRGTGEAEVLTRVARAEGAVVRGTWFGNVWHVYGDRAGFAQSLRAAGAAYVLPALPFDLFGMGGCGWDSPRADRVPVVPVRTFG